MSQETQQDWHALASVLSNEVFDARMKSGYGTSDGFCWQLGTITPGIIFKRGWTMTF